MTTTAKDRLRSLEKFAGTGEALKEIRDNELYRVDGFNSWDDYLKHVCDQHGISRTIALRQIEVVSIRAKLPELASQWPNVVVKEFARLAPQDTNQPQRRDVTALRKQDVQRVASRAVGIAENRGKSVTASIVREAVDIELGIPKKSPKPKQDFGIDLPIYLRQKIGQIEGIIEVLGVVPVDGWEHLENSEPLLAKGLVAKCRELITLLER
jgi:hypothetical protein